MAIRRDPDLVPLDQGGGIFRLSPRSDRARDWLAANVKIGTRDGTSVLVARQQALPLLAAMIDAGLRVAGVY